MDGTFMHMTGFVPDDKKDEKHACKAGFSPDKASAQDKRHEGSKVGWLIYREADYIHNRLFADRLVAAAANRGLILLPILHESIRFGIRDGRLFAGISGKEMTAGRPDFAIQRAVDPFLAEHLEQMGVRLYNRAAISGMCNDKARTYREVGALGVPMLPTWFMDRNAISSAKEDFPWPVVVKSVGGRGGAEVHLARDAAELGNLAGILTEGRQVVQPMCGTPGTDIRVFVVGQRPVAAIRRQSTREGLLGFRANFSMGGRAEVYKLDAGETRLVERIASAFPFDYVGIDFLLDAEGRFLFNEIEDAVGSRTLSACTDIDIADLFLTHVADTLPD